jgi:uncharacterized protein YdcH (DUF465 family)
METTRLNALLLEQNKEYCRLHRQHQDLELRLEDRDDRQARSGHDPIEIRRIKKRKLVLKDRMATIAQEYTSQQSSRS